MIVRVKDNTITQIREKREFVMYLLKIKHHVKIDKILKQYIQHR